MGIHLQHPRRAAIAAIAVVTTTTGAVTLTSTADAREQLARADLTNTAGETVGEVVFQGRGGNVDRVAVRIDAPGISATNAFHGFHVHTVGNCAVGQATDMVFPFGAASGHWNPTTQRHGGHTGDLPSLLLDEAGTASAEFDTHRFAVEDLFDSDGSAVILHDGRDNFANIPDRYSTGGVAGPDTATNGTGDAGTRYACGVVTPA